MITTGKYHFNCVRNYFWVRSVLIKKNLSQLAKYRTKYFDYRENPK